MISSEHLLIGTPYIAVTTVEKAAAAKVFFEIHYNNALGHPTPRSIRRRNLECAILDDPALSAMQQEALRRELALKESDHLRETRVMKASGLRDLQGKTTTASKYEVVKVLGKGSFGVVRLVREKADDNE
jgi:protein-serine/threonine kinase